MLPGHPGVLEGRGRRGAGGGPLSPQAEPGPSADLLGHYASGYERGRLLEGAGVLERARTEEVLERHLPAAPALILDVGGGPGAYACWLAARGYEVHLVDAVPLHVEQALVASAAQPQHPLASARVGDARRLDVPDGTQDAVLLLGPLYHLTERAERVSALAEAGRVVRPGGLVVVAAISRFASLMDGLFQGFLADPRFASIVDADLRDGQHRNPTGDPRWFTTAFFHHTDDLVGEAADAGLNTEDLVGLEGPGWLLPDLAERWTDPERRRQVLAAAREVEREPSLLGLSAHLLLVARRTPRQCS